MPTSRQQRRAAGRAGKPSGRPIGSRSVLLAIALAGAALAAWIAWDRLGQARLIRDGAPSWSPDGKQVVFYSERDGRPADLFVMNADGSAGRRLTNTTMAEGYPAWSPDGRRIAFEGDSPNGNFDIYVMDADGSNVHRLTSDPRRDVGPAWSPDGTQIVFMSDRAGQDFDIYSMRADGSSVERLTAGATTWFPQFSPDGARLAFHVGRDVHVFELKTRALQPLTKDPENGMYPTWSPDGKRIAFMSWRNGRTEIFMMNADGSDQRVLVSTASGSAIDPRWSPDGSRIVFVETPATEERFGETARLESVISVVDVATGTVTKLSR
jgi:Tol biopolymer transport system component